MGALCSFLSYCQPIHAEGLHCTATDGDTLAYGPKRVWVIGLDAPELRARRPAEFAMTRAARGRLGKLVAGGATLHPHGRDRYRRLLAVVTDASGRDVAGLMVREGLARPYYGRGRWQGWCGG